MPIGQTIVPVSACNNTNAGVPESIKLGDAMQLALVNQGDGFYNFRGTISVNNVTRYIKDVNGEVIPGTGMQVKVRDYIALVDGIIIGGQNKSRLDPTKFDVVNLGNISGTKYLTVSPKTVVTSDGIDHKDHDKGLFSVDSTAPDLDSGKILVAKLTIPPATTQITAGMIDNSVKDYLIDIDHLDKDVTVRINMAIQAARIEISQEIATAIDALRVEITGNLPTFDARIDAVEAAIATINTNITNLQSAVDANSVNINSLNTTLTNSINQLQADLLALQQFVLDNIGVPSSALQDQIDALSDAVAQNSTFIADLQSRVTLDEGDILALNSAINAPGIGLQERVSNIENMLGIEVVAYAPAAPSNLVSNNVTKTTLSLAWLDNSGLNLDRTANTEIEMSLNNSLFSNIGTVLYPNATFNVTGLTAGTTYYFKVRAVNTIGASAYSNTATVTTVATSPIMQVTPLDGYSPTGTEGGPFSPSSKQYTITNTGDAVLNYSVSKSEAWLTLTNASGSINPTNNVIVTVSTNASTDALAAGNFNDLLVFTNLVDGVGNTVRPVQITVTPGAVLTTRGLVSWWKLEEASTSANAIIDSADSNNGTRFGTAPITASGHIGSAHTFSGDDWIRVTNQPNMALTTEMSIEMWINPSTTVPLNLRIIRHGTVSSNGYEVTYENGTLTISGPGFGGLGDSFVLPIGSWTHVVFTFKNPGNIKTYINGTMNSFSGASGNMIVSSQDMFIGAEAANPIRGFRGALDEVRLYNVELTASEVTQNYNLA